MYRLIYVTALVMLSMSSADAEPALIAEYESEYSFVKEDGSPASTRIAWRFERGKDYVVARNPERGVDERWQRDDGQRVWYTRVFHQEKRVLEYSPVDLNLTGATSNWEQIASIIDPAALAALDRGNDVESMLHRTAVVYRGERQGQSIEVHWLEREKLPALVQKKNRHGTQTLRLVSLSVQAGDESLRRQAAFEGYDVLDFSDVGDRHHDPFIERLMKYEGVWLGH